MRRFREPIYIRVIRTFLPIHPFWEGDCEEIVHAAVYVGKPRDTTDDLGQKDQRRLFRVRLPTRQEIKGEVITGFGLVSKGPVSWTVEFTFPCTACNQETTQKPIPTDTGYILKCKACGNRFSVVKRSAT